MMLVLKMTLHIILLKSIRVHLSPESSCGLVAHTLRILAQWYILSLWDIQLSFDWKGFRLNDIIDSEAYEVSTGLSGFKSG